jgi:hypothetical protein
VKTTSDATVLLQRGVHARERGVQDARAAWAAAGVETRAGRPLVVTFHALRTAGAAGNDAMTQGSALRISEWPV